MSSTRQVPQAGSTRAAVRYAQPLPGVGAIVLAAGIGKRMHSKLVKVLHPIAGRPLVLYPVEVAARTAGQGVAVVVGHQAERVRAVIEARFGNGARGGAVRVVEQPQQQGTGHAVLQARKAFSPGPARPEAYLILNGDTPLISEATIRRLYRTHRSERAAVTMLTALLDDPSGYGRVVRSAQTNGTKRYDSVGRVVRIVEERDASDWERQLREINAGAYVVDGQFLFQALERLQPANTQGEYYLTDLVRVAIARGLKVSAEILRDPQEGLGVNSRRQLVEAEQVMRRRLADQWMEAGVTLLDPHSIRLDADVTIGADTVVYPGVALEGQTQIGEDCVIRSHARLTDCRLGNRVLVQDCCVLKEAILEDGASIGPFAHLRPGAIVRRDAKVGNFVEMKQADLGEASKANHLTYLGDAEIGRRVNIGAGTVTCNYDGVSKHRTVIGDEVFVGSDALFVAPVTVGRGALIAAGSTVTQDVPENALAIGRAVQVNKPGWAARRRAMAIGDAEKIKADRRPSPQRTSTKAASGRARNKKAKKGRTR